MFAGFCVVCKQHVTRHSFAFQPRVPTLKCRSNERSVGRHLRTSFLLSLHLAAVSRVRTRAGHQEQWLFTLDLYSAILPVQFGAFFLCSLYTKKIGGQPGTKVVSFLIARTLFSFVELIYDHWMYNFLTRSCLSSVQPNCGNFKVYALCHFCWSHVEKLAMRMQFACFR